MNPSDPSGRRPRHAHQFNTNRDPEQPNENEQVEENIPPDDFDPEMTAEHTEDSDHTDSDAPDRSDQGYGEEPDNTVNSEMQASPITEILHNTYVASHTTTRLLSILNGSMAEMEKQIESYPNMQKATDILDPLWAQSFRNGMEHLLKGNALSDAADRNDAWWQQRIDINGKPHAFSKASQRGGKGDDNTITGERAIMELTNALGLGSMIQIPLWHSGIWVTLKPPTEGALLELERRIALEKIHLGRYSSGMIFSATSVYSVMHVLNFVLDHVHDATVKNVEPEALKSVIRINDINVLIWGLACATYPEGYEYSRPCTVNPTECQHVVTGKLNLAKLFWTDRDALSDWQKRHMTYRSHKSTEEELQTYQKEHTRGNAETIQLQDNIEMELQVPTIRLFEQTGRSWVDGIVEDVDEALGTRLQGDDRNEYLIEQGRATELCQYAHWVNAITINDSVIRDRETIDASMARLSSHEKITQTFFEKVGQYIDNSTIAMIAMVKYDCPSCGETQEDDLLGGRHPHLLPIDVLRTFFTLLGHLLARTQARINTRF